MPKTLAYFTLPSIKDEQGNFIACLAEYGVAGYNKTDISLGKDETIAKKLVADQNEEMGLDPKDVTEIVASTMRFN